MFIYLNLLNVINILKEHVTSKKPHYIQHQGPITLQTLVFFSNVFNFNVSCLLTPDTTLNIFNVHTVFLVHFYSIQHSRYVGIKITVNMKILDSCFRFFHLYITIQIIICFMTSKTITLAIMASEYIPNSVGWVEDIFETLLLIYTDSQTLRRT